MVGLFFTQFSPISYRIAVVALSVVFLLATRSDAQVFAPGPSISGLFDTVLDVPSPPPVGISVSGGVGGVPGQLAQLNINSGGSATNNFTVASGAEVNVDGGSIGNNLTALSGSEVNLVNGTIGFDFQTESNRVDILGGTIDDRFIADIAAEVNLSGGSIGDDSEAKASSEVNITGGSIGSNFTASGGAMVNLSSGSIGTLFTADAAIVDITGGNVGSQFIAQNNSTVNISGTAAVSNNFDVGSGSVANISSGTVSAGLTALAGGTINISGTADTARFVAENGSVVNVSGGQVGVGVRAETGSEVNISGGTIENSMLVFADSDVTISGGTLFDNLQVFSGAEVEISGGVVGRFAEIEGTINVTGGVLDSSAMVEPGGLLNISSGSAGNGIEVQDSGSLTISGGSLGFGTMVRSFSLINIRSGSVAHNLTADLASVVNVTGGSVGDNFETDGVVNIQGGDFLGSIEATTNAQVNLFGTDFELDDVPVPGLVSGAPTTIFSRGGQTLSATLVDGTTFDIDLNTLFNPGDDFVDFSAILTVTLITLPGDYNDDGTVDVADYTVWRDNLGAPAGTLANDINGGIIGNAQYETFVENFGESISSHSSATAVPEPSTALPLALAAWLIWLTNAKRAE